MITIKAGEVQHIMEAGKTLFDKPMDADISYRFAKLLVALQPELEAFEMARLNLCVKYAEKDDNGKAKKDDNGHFMIADPAAFGKAFKALTDASVCVNFSPVKLSDLKDQGIQLRPVDLAKLAKLIMD